ncbi:MAG: MBOAT family protein, partial [Clostridia bacterium]|nr:MBOAT family protein [Clostridia bacterium]
MLFSSIPFLYYFLPSVLILYFLAPQKLKNTVLLISSLVFYGWGEPKYVILMVASIVIGFVSGLLIEAINEKSKKKLILTINIIIDLGFLGFFKYSNFFIENFNNVTGLSIELLSIALPIGISFYTFQILSYAVDVYRGTTKAQRNIISLATYITMFPQLIAGPIVRYTDVVDYLDKRTLNFEKISYGLRRFIIGLSKKVLIANALGELCVTFKASDDKALLFYWLYAVSFCVQVYFDFSGYSDMAIGLGKILGFDFMENFNFPFISKSVAEFWRRWHISLGSWFRDYVYIPLGGNRVKKPRWIFNILVVWFLTGFWHGAAWNFIVWGLYFVIFLVFEKTKMGKFITKTQILNRVYTLFFIIINFVIFDAVNMGEAFSYIKAMLGFSGIPLFSNEFIYYFKEYAVILLIGLIGATPLVKKVAAKLTGIKGVKVVVGILEPIILVVLLILVTAYLVDGS